MLRKREKRLKHSNDIRRRASIFNLFKWVPSKSNSKISVPLCYIICTSYFYTWKIESNFEKYIFFLSKEKKKIWKTTKKNQRRKNNFF